VVTHAESEVCPQDNCLELATHEVVVIGHNSTVRIGPVCADHALQRLAQTSLQHEHHVKVEIEIIE
jgi:hypothetical protein